MFKFALICPKQMKSTVDSQEPFGDDGDYEYLVMVGSRLLAAADYRFTLGGFGSDDWNLDVEYDMSSFIEGLPDLLADLRTKGAGEIDLYAQGVERVLKFSRVQDTVAIACISRTDWTPNPPIEYCDYVELEVMLKRLATNFAHALHRLSSLIARLEPFSKWLREEV
ncbi:hypothetical protein [Nonomuraea rubra]|uniref:Uncharacterized protein n=1 Tax=Nonomuraea rubra TaxID=46180 RepID=A0A7X0U628_9ACTN|nr:hypothetical protein [Nonomuraea rubra]MBB6556546.1 hypothetical protein [Nonomuraea rubra]